MAGAASVAPFVLGGMAMAWAKLDDGFFRHPKIMAVGRDARDLYLAALCYASAQLTDGFIPVQAVRLLAAEAEIDDAPNAVERLVRGGLWLPADGGYQVKDYLDYNPSAEQVKARRAATAERVANWRTSHADYTTPSNAVTNAVGNDVSTHPPVPRPRPVPGPVPTPKPVPTHESAPAPAREAVASAAPTREPKYPPAFIAFWTAYPRKENKPEALKAWFTLRPDGETADAILAGVARWQQSDQWARKVYQHPSTWLRGRQWEDEPMAATEAAPARASPNGKSTERFNELRDFAAQGLEPISDRNGLASGHDEVVHDVVYTVRDKGRDERAQRPVR
jgi:hypothetical protein